MAKGAPDYSKDVNLRGWDGTALRPVKVDTDGQLYALMRGLFGETLKDIAVDEDGQIIAILKGASGNNVLVDASGFIAAKMKGYDGANYQDIKVDDAGRMIAMLNAMYDTTPTPLKCDTNGQIQINLKAQGLDRVSTLAKAPTGTTPIFKSAVASNATVIVHTVTAGKIFMLTGASLGIASTETAGYGYIAVRNTADAIQYYIFRQYIYAMAGESANIAFSLPPVPAYEIAAGWDIVLYSADAAIFTSAAICGWEESS